MRATQPPDDREQIAAYREEHIGRLLLIAQRNYSASALVKLHQCGHTGLNLAHTNLLRHLDVDGTRITTLAERAGITKQAIGSLVGELEARAYVRREVDPQDRRAVRITFTDIGWQFLRDAYAVKREIEAEYCALLGEPGMQELQRLLERLVHSDGQLDVPESAGPGI
jgi:DNA-binding MarR family transcriptional regulator